MKIIIMNGSKSSWYGNRVGKVFRVQAIDANKDYITKDGKILKTDAEIIEK